VWLGNQTIKSTGLNQQNQEGKGTILSTWSIFLTWQKNPLALQQMPAAMPAGTNHEDIPLSAIMNPILHTVADKLQTHSPFQTKNLWWIPDPLLLRYWQYSLIDYSLIFEMEIWKYCTVWLSPRFRTCKNDI
jgi:hypothetical protein